MAPEASIQNWPGDKPLPRRTWPSSICPTAPVTFPVADNPKQHTGVSRATRALAVAITAAAAKVDLMIEDSSAGNRNLEQNLTIVDPRKQR